MTTRGGEPGSLPDGIAGGTGGVGNWAGISGLLWVGGGSAGTPVPTPRAKGLVGGFFCGKSGVVLAAGGEPVTGGATGRACGTAVVGGRVTLGIGLVTAVDHAGGTFCAGAGVRLVPGLIASVEAAEMFGRGVILVEAGLRGRGGRLTRRVSRLGGFGLELSGSEGVAASAIDLLFYSYSGKCSMAKLVTATSFRSGLNERIEIIAH